MKWVMMLAICGAQYDDGINRVDVIEVHSLMDGQGTKLWTQVIFWKDGYVVAWKWNHTGDKTPRKGGGRHRTWMSMWTCGGQTFVVVAKRAHWSQLEVDPEVIDRERLPMSKRIGLRSN